jgi:glycosyltransferase involved in cell wall biosynthesis
VHAAAAVRIVHLVIGGEVAGGQIVALRLARAAREAGHDVSFVSPDDGPFLALVREAGLDARVVPLGGALDLGALLRLTRALRAARADVVHTHGHFSVNVLGRLAGRLAGARVLAHMHIENAFRAGRGRRAQVALDNATARLCFAIVAVSDATRASLLAQGYPASRVVTIHNGIEPVEPAEPVRLAEGPTVLEVARLAEVKGQRTLLRALAQLDASAVLAGRDIEAGGAYEQELRAEAERLGVAGRVVFAGLRDDVPGLLAGCDVFCLPSTMEGLPLVVLEAMAQGRPVVATAVGGTPELVVDGETGLLVPPDDVDALARALGRLLAEPELARRMGEDGRARVREHYSAASAAERVLALYQQAV